MDAGELLGKRLKEIRKKMGISQEDVAFRCDTHPSHIGQMERGERNPTLETLEKIALGLDISVSELLDFDVEPEFTYYDALTNKIISYILRMSAPEKKQVLTIVKALAKSKDKSKE